MYIYIKKISFVLAALLGLLASSCSEYYEQFPGLSSDTAPFGDSGNTRLPSEEVRHTFIMFSLGHNNLSSSLQQDLRELRSGFVPGNGRNDNVLLIFSHRAPASGSWSTPNSPVLERVYTDITGNVVCDTLKVWPKETVSASAATIRQVLEFARDEFPSKSYGMLLSSHATGYLPAGFYGKHDSYIFDKSASGAYKRARQPYVSVPYYEIPREEGEPMVKSIGQDVLGSSSHEMELAAFSDAIPMKLEYILFDACLMGGVEVAWQLRDKCRYVGFSQAEVLSNGFVYTEIGNRLLSTRTPDPKGVCNDYFQSYAVQTGVYNSATISMVDCSAMEPLAIVCSELFARYRNAFSSMDTGKVQPYFRQNLHWFYDLESIVTNLGITEEESARLKQALEECVVYKNATEYFMQGANGFEIKTFSGLSMYLPANGHSQLDLFYKTLDWNDATGLVR